MLQILHDPPSLQPVVLMGNNLRRALLSVKGVTQYVVAACTRSTTYRARVAFPVIYMAGSAIVERSLFRCRSTAYPPLLRKKSAGFAQRLFSRNPQQTRGISTGFAHDFRRDYQQHYPASFSAAFSSVFRTEKGRKASGKGDLRKTRFCRPRPLQMVVERMSAHTMWHVEHPCLLVLAGRAGSAELPATLPRRLERSLWNPCGSRELHEVVEARETFGPRDEAGGALAQRA